MDFKVMNMEQRELKFRAWVDNNDGYAQMEYFTLYDRVRQYCGGYNVMQYTGFKYMDGKGKEIYHKDLIVNKSRNGGKPHLVEWSDKLGAWVGVYRGLEYFIAEELHEIEVVGNFFENPELVKHA